MTIFGRHSFKIPYGTFQHKESSSFKTIDVGQRGSPDNHVLFMNLSMIIQNTKLILTNDFTDCNDDKTRNNNLSAGNIYLAEELNFNQLIPTSVRKLTHLLTLLMSSFSSSDIPVLLVIALGSSFFIGSGILIFEVPVSPSSSISPPEEPLVNSGPFLDSFDVFRSVGYDGPKKIHEENFQARIL